MFSNIPKYITDVTSRLEEAGFDAYLVGGCVRDRAMGKTPHDYDVTTNAKPHEMQKVFENYRVIETGLKHGTLTVVSDGECVEITTYRIDGEYADNRHPTEVSFTDDVKLDLSRRDFTVNAMAYSTKLGLCDLFDGMRHLREGRIVCVGCPTDRFNEDGLRILRALRFASTLDFDIDPATAEAIHALKYLLAGISKERILTELSKLIVGTGAGRIISAYSDVLEVCSCGLTASAWSDAAENIDALPSDPAVRFAFACRLTSDEAGTTAKECAAGVMRGLKSSAALAKRTSALSDAMSTPFPETDADVMRLMGRFDREDVLAYAALRDVYSGDGALAEAFLARYGEIAAASPCVKVSELAVSGNDVMRLTGAKGAAVGKTLAALLDDVIEGRLENTPASLEARLASLKENEK